MRLGAPEKKEAEKMNASTVSSMFRQVNERLSAHPMKNGHPILPYGMNAKTLYDD